MKKRRITGVVIAILLIALVTVSVVADGGYTGTVEEAQTRLGAYDTMETPEDKAQLLDSVLDYVATVNPNDEGYSELLLGIDEKELALADEYLALACAKSTADERKEGLNTLYTYLVKHPFTDDTEGDDNFNVRLSKATEDALELYLTESRALSDPEAKHKKLDLFISLVSLADFTLTEELEASLNEDRLACANLYLGVLNSASGNARYGVALRKLSYFYKNHPIADTTAGYEEFKVSYEAAIVTHSNAMNAALSELILGAHAKDLTSSPIINLNFNAENNVENPRVSVGNITAEKNIESGVTISFIGEEDGVDGDGYYTVRYDVEKKHFRTAANITGISGSFVFEMDITTFGKLPNADQPGSVIWVENGSASVRDRQWDLVYFSINSNGYICKKASSTDVLLEDAIVPGEWVRITMVVGMEDNKVDLYADYELIASYSIADTQTGYTATPQRIAIGANPNLAGGQFSIDNVKLYQGYSPRDVDYFASLEPGEQFAFLVERLYDKNSNNVKKEYYEAAHALLGEYWDEENESYKTSDTVVMSAVDKLVGFDLESLNKSLSDDNLDALAFAVSKITSYSRGEATFEVRSYYLEKADKVLSAAGGLITEGDTYTECVNTMTEVRLQLIAESEITLFVDAVDKFYHASNLEDMEASYVNAKQLAKKVEIELTKTGTFPKFTSAYEKYLEMDVVITDKRSIEGSKKLLSILSFISEYENEEAWSDNYDFLVDYVLIVQSIIESGNYDPFYGDTEKSIVAFEPMSQYFSERIAHERAAYIESQLDRYDNSDVYFERFGILVNLKEYIKSNKIDTEDSVIAPLYARIEAGLSDLESQREEYEALVVSNTKIFIEKSAMLVGSIGYTEMRRICDEIAVYFYAMDVKDATAQDAVSLYIARCNQLEAVEKHAADFSDEVMLLVADEKNLLDRVIKCNAYVDALEIAAPGAKAALETYKSVCAGYDAKVTVSNSELQHTRSCTAYLSNNSGLNSFVTLIISELGK